MKAEGRKLLKRVLAWSVVLSALLGGVPFTEAQTVNAATTSTKALQQDNLQNGVTLQCWNWSYNEIAENMEKIADLGYSAVQTSPIQQSKEGTKGKDVGSKWWVYYQPASFSIDNTGNSALGTKAEFENMCKVAHANNVKVIVDVVTNHMGNETRNNLSSAIISDIKNDSSCWHDISKDTTDYSSRYNITQYCMDGLPDLNTSNKKIQNYALSFLKECIDAGADGFRFDGAKHIETPQDSSSGCGSDFWPTVISGATSYASSTRGFNLYCYGEILDKLDSNGTLPVTAYTQYMSITDNETGNLLRNNVNSGNATGAGSSYYQKNFQGNVTASKLVLWAESHDTYANEKSSSVSQLNINKTWALVAARADAMGLYFARPYSSSTQLGVADDTGWAYNEVGVVNRFHNAFVGQTEYMASENGFAYCERGTTGVVLVNCSNSSGYVDVTAHKMVDGTYKDQVSGNTFTVSGGKIKGQIGDKGFAVVYNINDDIVIPGTDNIAYIKLPDGWGTTVYCYSYDSATETVTNGSWPGVQMTSAGNGIYYYKVPSNISNPLVIFSDGSNQYPASMESGLSLSGSMIYQDGVWTTYIEEVETSNVAYIRKSSSWGSNMYCYAYSKDDESITNGSWPGASMTCVSGDLYKYSVPENITNPLVIFTDGTNQYPASMEPGLSLSGSMIYENSQWVQYEE